MLKQDYLVRMFSDFARAIRLAVERSRGKDPDPDGTAEMLELQLDAAIDMDSSLLLNLTPESVASVLQVSGTDPRLVEYICRTLLLESRVLMDAGKEELSDLREDQAFAVAEAFGLQLDAHSISAEGFEELFDDTFPEDYRELRDDALPEDCQE